jgi:Tol biopolymer transport system component
MPAQGGAARQLTFLNAFSTGGVWSPDGHTVAFGSNEGGRMRVWTVNADGSSPRPLPTDDLSESYDIAWASGRRLVYQQTGNRNYSLVHLPTLDRGALVADSSVGWATFASHSPDGKRIAISWNRRPDRGVWVVDTERDSARERLVYPAPEPMQSDPVPIGWSADSRYLYALDGQRAAYRGASVPYELTIANARVLRIPLAGGPAETLVSLPFDEVGSVTMFPSGHRLVCSVYSSRSDVWIVENFDPTAATDLARRPSFLRTSKQPLATRAPLLP